MGFALGGVLEPIKPPSEVPEAIRLYKKFGDLYSTFNYAGICLAGAFSFLAIMWDGLRGKRAEIVIYWCFLLVTLPISVANYWSGDGYNARWKQAVVDVVLVFVATVCLLMLMRLASNSDGARVAKAIAVFFIAFQGVLIPGVYAVLWLLNAERAVSLATTKSFTPGWVSALAAIGGLAVSIANYRATRPTVSRAAILSV